LPEIHFTKGADGRYGMLSKPLANANTIPSTAMTGICEQLDRAWLRKIILKNHRHLSPKVTDH